MSIRAWEFESPPRHSNGKGVGFASPRLYQGEENGSFLVVEAFKSRGLKERSDGRVAQLVRASVLQTEGQRFESSRAHSNGKGVGKTGVFSWWKY